jgi:hypothetical protein
MYDVSYQSQFTKLITVFVVNITPIKVRQFLDQIGEILEKGQVRSTRNRRACMRNLMAVEEAKGVCKDRSKWKEVISAYPKAKRA